MTTTQAVAARSLQALAATAFAGAIATSSAEAHVSLATKAVSYTHLTLPTNREV